MAVSYLTRAAKAGSKRPHKMGLDCLNAAVTGPRVGEGCCGYTEDREVSGELVNILRFARSDHCGSYGKGNHAGFCLQLAFCET
jgi:hypothetical protein